MAHLAAVRVGAIPGIAGADIEDAVDDEAAGADVVEADFAVDAVEQGRADAGKADQGRIGACRRSSSSKRREDRTRRDGAGRVWQRRPTPVVVPLPRHRLLNELEGERGHARVVEEEGGEAVVGPVVELVHGDERERRARHPLVTGLGPHPARRHDHRSGGPDDPALDRHQPIAVREDLHGERRRRDRETSAAAMRARRRRRGEGELALQGMPGGRRYAERHEVVIVNRPIARRRAGEQLGGGEAVARDAAMGGDVSRRYWGGAIPHSHARSPHGSAAPKVRRARRR